MYSNTKEILSFNFDMKDFSTVDIILGIRIIRSNEIEFLLALIMLKMYPEGLIILIANL